MPSRLPVDRTPGAPRNQHPLSPMNGTIDAASIPRTAAGSVYHNVNLRYAGGTVKAQLVYVMPNAKGLPTHTDVLRGQQNGRFMVLISPYTPKAAVPAPAAPSHIAPPQLPDGGAAAARSPLTVGDVFSFAGGFFDRELVKEAPNAYEHDLLEGWFGGRYEFRSPDDIDTTSMKSINHSLNVLFALHFIRQKAKQGITFFSRAEQAVYREQVKSFEATKGSPATASELEEIERSMNGVRFLRERYGDRIDWADVKLTPAEEAKFGTQGSLATRYREWAQARVSAGEHHLLQTFDQWASAQLLSQTTKVLDARLQSKAAITGRSERKVSSTLKEANALLEAVVREPHAGPKRDAAIAAAQAFYAKAPLNAVERHALTSLYRGVGLEPERLAPKPKPPAPGAAELAQTLKESLARGNGVVVGWEDIDHVVQNQMLAGLEQAGFPASDITRTVRFRGKGFIVEGPQEPPRSVYFDKRGQLIDG